MKQYINTERADLFDVSMMIVMRADIKGKASDDRIRAAFDKAVSAHEVLGTKTVIGTDGSAYYTSADPAQSMTFCNDDTEAIIAREERIRFETEHGEFLRAFCTNHTDEGFTVVFCMHHLGGDGKSLTYFIETFMQALAGEKLTYREMRRTDVSDIPVGKLPFLYSAYASYCNSRWKRERRRFGFDDLDRAFDKFWSTHRTKVQEIHFDSAATERILADCKKSGVKFTSYITALILKNTGGRQSIGYAVDGRTDSNRAMGNQATGVSVDHRYDRRKSLAENASAIQSVKHQKLDDPAKKWLVLRFMGEIDGTLTDAVNMVSAGAYSSSFVSSFASAMGYGDKVKDLSITNLTKLDIPTAYGEYSVEGVSFIPPVVSYAKNVVGIVTSNGCMNITLHTYSDNPLSLNDMLEGIGKFG